MTDYTHTKTTSAPYSQAVEHVSDALADEGFGVLTRIDVQETLKKKLDIDTDEYVILGACNPPFAHQALQAEHEIGALLPCNVLVYVQDGQTHISTVLPTRMMSVVDNDALDAIAQEIEQRLVRVVDSAAQ